LRELFSPQQGAQLFCIDEATWLTGQITEDRNAAIRPQVMVMRELGVTEVTPESIIPRLTQAFPEAQSDDRIAHSHEFLGGEMPANTPRWTAWRTIRRKKLLIPHASSTRPGDPSTAECARWPASSAAGPPNLARPDEARSLPRAICETEADLLHNPHAGTLTARLHQQANAFSDRAVRTLCDELNATGTAFPRTNFRLILQLGASQDP